MSAHVFHFTVNSPMHCEMKSDL